MMIQTTGRHLKAEQSSALQNTVGSAAGFCQAQRLSLDCLA